MLFLFHLEITKKLQRTKCMNQCVFIVLIPIKPDYSCFIKLLSLPVWLLLQYLALISLMFQCFNCLLICVTSRP